MKATLDFDLTNAEDHYKFNQCVNAHRAFNALELILERFRPYARGKIENPGSVDEMIEIFERILDESIPAGLID